MNEEEIFQTLKEIIVEQLGVEEEKVTQEASFTDDLGADSLDVVELVMAIEERFNVEVSDDQADKIVAVSDLVEYIKNQQ
jgi:acyl carrier protein